jgi:tetratricopeptide (TPR) repeat protein
MARRPAKHVDDPVAVGQRVRNARLAAGISQRELAGDSCTTAYVSRIEAGVRVPSYQLLLEFAKRLGTTADFLATGQADQNISADFLEAEMALRLGDHNRAADLYHEALLRSDTPSEVAQARLGLGRLELKRGETRAGMELLERALDSGALPPGDATAAANALGRAYAAEGRFDEAIALFSRFLAQAREAGDQLDELAFGMLLANTYIDQGQFAQAQSTLAGILDLARETIDPMLRASLYWTQSRAYSAQRQDDRAAEYAALVVSTLKATDQTLEAARAVLMQAFIENDRGNPTLALELLDEAEPVLRPANDPNDLATVTIQRAKALTALGEPDEAATLLLGVGAKLKQTSPSNAALSYSAAADVFRSQGKTEQALEFYELAVETSVSADRQVADSLRAMAEIYEERGDAEKALELLKRALAIQAPARV